MPKVPLTTGAYQARSLIANAQRCVNLYMEKNTQDSTFPTTHYPMPGLRKTGQAEGVWRGLYRASNGRVYGVCGSTAYRISPNWMLTELGQVMSGTGPVRMVDNGVDLLMVDGSNVGYKIVIASDVLTKVTEEGFYGGSNVQFADGFFILPRPETNQFYISLANQSTFDPVDFALKAGSSDPLVTLSVTKRYIYLFGSLTTEVWSNQGGPEFPYSRMQGAFMEHGCAAQFSPAAIDGSVFWLSQSREGKYLICRTESFEAVKISTFAIDGEIQGYDRVDDAIGYAMQFDGHFFYVLTFPTAQKTWVYDLSTGEWNEWLSMDENGNMLRHRGNCYAFGNGLGIVGDHTNGKLYQLDLDYALDDDMPIQRIRSFPHMVEDGNRVLYRNAIFDFQVGENRDQNDTLISMRYSDTKGASWGNHLIASIGAAGEYYRSVRFNRLGMARDRIFEVSWSSQSRTALNGAFVEHVGARG